METVQTPSHPRSCSLFLLPFWTENPAPLPQRGDHHMPSNEPRCCWARAFTSHPRPEEHLEITTHKHPWLEAMTNQHQHELPPQCGSPAGLHSFSAMEALFCSVPESASVRQARVPLPSPFSCKGHTSLQHKQSPRVQVPLTNVVVGETHGHEVLGRAEIIHLVTPDTGGRSGVDTQ